MTKPYCNCREMGFTLSIFRANKEPLNICFFEHRNSDNLCALKWEGRLPVHGGSSVDDIPKKNYPDKWTLAKSVGCLQISEMIDWAKEEIKAATAQEEKDAA